MSSSDKTYFGEVEQVRIAGDLSRNNSIANITFTSIDSSNKKSEVTMTVNKALAERFIYYLQKSLDGDNEQYVEFW